MTRLTLSLLCLTVPLCLTAGAAAEDAPAKIAWYGTWDLAKTEAKRLNRPILLVSAAPHCHNISGIW